jgi:hypothetical protein
MNIELVQRNFENYDNMHQSLNIKWRQSAKERKITRTQLTTNTAVEVEEKAGETIADIGKTEVAITLSGSADNASTNGKIYTLVYEDNEGDQHTAVATGTATLNATPVAFVPPIAKYYAPVSFTASAADANVNVILLSGATTYGTISTTTVAATDAQLIGIGSVNIAQKTHVAGDIDKTGTFTYLTPWREIKYAEYALDHTDTSDEVTPTDVTSGLTVKDFYRRYELTLETVAGDEILVVAPGGATVYDVIKVGYAINAFTRYMALHEDNGRSYLGSIRTSFPSVADVVTMTVIYTPKDNTQQTMEYDVFGHDTLEFAEELEPLSEVIVKINDGNVAHANAKVIIRYMETPVEV